jgi:hypothetical protein
MKQKLTLCEALKLPKNSFSEFLKTVSAAELVEVEAQEKRIKDFLTKLKESK